MTSPIIAALKIIASCNTEDQLKSCENLAQNPYVAPTIELRQELYRAIIVRKQIILV